MHKALSKPKRAESFAPPNHTGMPYREIKGYKLFHTLEEDFTVYHAAEFRHRVFSLLTDYFILGVVIAIVRLPLLRILEQAGLNGNESKSAALTVIVNVLAFGICQIGPLLIWGQTLGKHLLGIRIVDTHSSAPITPMTVVLRELIGKPFSFLLLGVGFLFPMWRADKRALHDLIGKTKVVNFRK